MSIVSILNQGEEVSISESKSLILSTRELKEFKQKHFKDKVEILLNHKLMNTLIN